VLLVRGLGVQGRAQANNGESLAAQISAERVHTDDLRGRRLLRRVGVLLAATSLVLLTAPPAFAIDPPEIDVGALPPDETGPDQPTEPSRACSSPITFPNANFADKPWASDYLRLSDAQKFATGQGVTVAVIDTGVNGSPRVPAEPGGDFVDKAGNGMNDCDSHGTLTASIIAGRGSPGDGFIGVAPDARILSLRQTSDNFRPASGAQQRDPNDPNQTQTAGSLRSLARAIVHAANLGVGVINISEAACYKITRRIDESSLGAAIEYAVKVKNVVIVVAAGNTGQDWLMSSSRRRAAAAAPARAMPSSIPAVSSPSTSCDSTSTNACSRLVPRCATNRCTATCCSTLTCPPAEQNRCIWLSMLQLHHRNLIEKRFELRKHA
jgi:subtilisin family serine protease